MENLLKQFLVLLTLMHGTAGSLVSAEAKHLVFTYMGAPSTTLTANWQIVGNVDDVVLEDAVVYYDTVSREGDLEAYAQQARGEVFQIEGLGDRHIARVSLDGLQPDTSYYISARSGEWVLPEVKVRTVPSDDSPLRFVTGGDMGPSLETQKLLQNSASFDPLFAVVGGDIAYANGNLNSVGNWDVWLDYYTDKMVTSDGHTIPLVLAIGNHEVKGGFKKPKSHAPFFFGFFGQDVEKTYFARQFGANLLMLILDSGHISSHESQVDWMDGVLSDAEVVHTSAVYHVPLYPTHRDLMGFFSTQGREFWAPVFDAHRLTVAFENHDHTFKRSRYLREGAVVEDGQGTLYLGDGCWGRVIRAISEENPWYTAKAGSIQHFWVVDVDKERMSYQAVDLENRVFDVYPVDSGDAEAAERVFAAKQQLYKLPAGVLSLASMSKAVDLKAGAETHLTVSNVFEHPIEVQLRGSAKGGKGRVNILKSAFTLDPGISETIPVAISVKADAPVDLSKLKLSVTATIRVLDPKKDFAQEYIGSKGLKFE